MKVLGLFSGIGGFELGFQRAGFEIAAMCEIEPYCRAVLKKHWPKVPVFEDVKELTYETLRVFDCIPDVITGGFPCQDISLAGKGAGLEGERSGLWREFHRIIAETRPRYAVIENVSALRSRGLDVVLRQLAEIGYDAEWHCIPASAVGAPHRRDRVWIVAHAQGDAQRPDANGFGSHRTGQHQQGSPEPGDEQVRLAGSVGEVLADTSRLQPGRPEQRAERERVGPGGQSLVVADADINLGVTRRTGDANQGARGRDADRSGVESNGVANTHQPRLEIRLQGHAGEQPAAVGGDWWLAEPDVGRVAHGVPSRVDRLRSLGNAVVPQIPEILATAILEAEVYA